MTKNHFRRIEWPTISSEKQNELFQIDQNVEAIQVAKKETWEWFTSIAGKYRRVLRHHEPNSLTKYWLYSTKYSQRIIRFWGNLPIDN